jgi:hypothetical protein
MAKKVKAVKKAKLAAATKLTQIKGYKAVYVSIEFVVDEIVKEILAEMNLTIMAVGKTFAPASLDEWAEKLGKSVRDRLMATPPGDWNADRPKVLAVASDMAIIAAILSASAPTVAKGRVHAAFRAVKDHATCPGTLGSGRWCDFDI